MWQDASPRPYRSAVAEPKPVVEFLTRQNCPLCDDGWDDLDKWRRRYGFEVMTVDVDGDVDLQRRYGHQVPVVRHAGETLVWGRWKSRELGRLLKTLAGR